MPRPSQRNTGFFDTIEYVGPRPRKPGKKKPKFFGGWVILLIAVGIPFFFLRNLIPSLRAEQEGTSLANVDRTVEKLNDSVLFGDRLAAAALAQTRSPGVYNNDYRQIPYPGGDVPAGKGNAEDVVVRAYREMGIDLQKLVHEDMEKNFRDYPQLSNSTGGPDANIDHRRAPNLKRFFERHGETIPTGSRLSAAQCLPGDILFFTRPGGSSAGQLGTIEMHVAVVVPGPGSRSTDSWIVHNLDDGVKWEDSLLSYSAIAHFRFGK